MELIRRHLRLHHLLRVTGVRSLYQVVHETVSSLKYGRQRRVVVSDVELLFSVRDDASRDFFFHPYWFGELYEKEVTVRLAKQLRECQCFVDVGAHMGFYTILAAKMMADRGGVVHAIEMDIDNIRRTRESVDLNRLDNVVIHHVAVGDRIGTAEYYRCGSPVNSLVVTPNHQELYTRTTVRMTTLDTLTEQTGIEPDIVKIDVEGAEYLVLRGMENLLKQSHLKIYCEVHLHQGGRGSLSASGHTVQEVFDLLKHHGFLVKQLPLRQDSHCEGGVVQSASEIVESTMLYAVK